MPVRVLVEVTQDHHPYVGKLVRFSRYVSLIIPVPMKPTQRARMPPSPHPMLVEIGNAGLNAVEDVTGIVVELDDGELGGRSSCQAVQ